MTKIETIAFGTTWLLMSAMMILVTATPLAA